jgi:hyperosmotically inducible protein
MRRILLLAFAFTIGLVTACAQSDQELELQEAVQKALHAYSLDTIHASVEHGFVTLTGMVDLCQARLLADRTLSGIPGVKTIWDRVQVSGPTVPDRELKARVTRILADRLHKMGGLVGGLRYGSISAQVQDGAVTLTGNAATQFALPAIEDVAGVPGVKNVIDHVRRVGPFSTDWGSMGAAIGVSEAGAPPPPRSAKPQ